MYYISLLSINENVISLFFIYLFLSYLYLSCVITDFYYYFLITRSCMQIKFNCGYKIIIILSLLIGYYEYYSNEYLFDYDILQLINADI